MRYIPTPPSTPDNLGKAGVLGLALTVWCRVQQRRGELNPREVAEAFRVPLAEVRRAITGVATPREVRHASYN